MKTFFENLPKELEEAATIDGASSMQILLRILLPLSKPAFVTIALFYAVGHWNSYFPAMIYLQSEHLYPVQLFLRKIVLLGQTADITGEQGMSTETILMAESLKYATIMIKFIIGQEPLSNFDKFVGELKQRGLDELVKTYNAAYQRALKAAQ